MGFNINICKIYVFWADNHTKFWRLFLNFIFFDLRDPKKVWILSLYYEANRCRQLWGPVVNPIFYSFGGVSGPQNLGPPFLSKIFENSNFLGLPGSRQFNYDSKNVYIVICTTTYTLSIYVYVNYVQSPTFIFKWP